MKSYRYDIHIHSALSPCADILLSPNNILNYATLERLDIIAVTDHNSLAQQETLDVLQESYDLLYIYGVEVTTQENIHVLCFFKTMEDVKKMEPLLLQHLTTAITTKEQPIFDVNDSVVRLHPYDLLGETSWTIQTLYQQVEDLDGLFCLAHVDRYNAVQVQEVLKYTSFFHAIELANKEQLHIIQEFFPTFLESKLLLNSDAHDLVQIGKHHATIQLSEKSVKAFFQYFREDKYD